MGDEPLARKSFGISSKPISPPNTAAPRDIFHVRQHSAGKVAALESERKTP